MNTRVMIHFILYPFLLGLVFPQILAQYPDDQIVTQLNAYFNEMYGLDQKLIRGVQYYNKYPRSMGNGFLDSDAFVRGRVVINEVEYDDVKIRYDIYEQQVNLHFSYSSTTENTVILNRDVIEEFEMNGMLFRKYFFPETDTSFLQIISEGKVTCLYYWYKNLTNQTSLRYVYEFSDPRKKSFLLIDSVLYQYNGERQFVKLFPESKPALRKYFKQNQIRLRKAPDSTVMELIEFCNSLTDPESEE
jgi:hypothetical protein